MTTAATDIVSRIAELSDSAFAAFCEDIAGMFGVEMRCDRKQAQSMAVRSLREHFKKLAAVHLAKADGALNGTFQLVFDQAGLFILSGVIVMLPESRILEDAKRGSLEEATHLQDASREVGNLLVGSWDRVFRENCPGHLHFVKTSTFLGKPWEKPEQIELQANGEAVVVLYEMAIEPYPSFTCAAVFPMTILSKFMKAESPDEQGQAQEPAKGEEAKGKDPSPEAAGSSPKTAQKSPEPAAGQTPPAGSASSPKPAAKPEEPKPAAPAAPAAAQQTLQGPSPAVAKENPAQPVADATAKAPQDSASPVSQTTNQAGVIPPGRRSPVIEPGMLPSELVSAQSGVADGMPHAAGLEFLDTTYIRSQPQAGMTEFLSRSAAEIMDKGVVWAGSEETVQDVIAKMQQHNVGYVLIGTNGVLEGLVSGSNILAAVSLYLRPMFAKWRRPQDDATLGVKVKWIMSRPVRTVRPDATVAAMIESMRRCGGRCLPVVDAKGAVQGIVTVFDILLRILEADNSVSWKGRPPQAPPLLI